MTIKIFRYTLIVFLGVLLQGCSGNANMPQTSTDITELEKYINLEGHKPIKAKWSYRKMGNQSDSRTPGLLQMEHELFDYISKLASRETKILMTVIAKRIIFI